MLDTSKLNTELNELITRLKDYLSQIRTGRPNPDSFNSLMVEAYGTRMDLKSLAAISVDGLSIIISPFDKSIVKDIIKTILTADLGYSPVDDGGRVRINIPPMTEEIRIRTVEQMYDKIENEYRKHLRMIRQDHLQKLNKLTGVSEDQVKLAEKQLQKLIDDTNALITEMGKKKETEIKDISKL